MIPYAIIRKRDGQILGTINYESLIPLDKGHRIVTRDGELLRITSNPFQIGSSDNQTEKIEVTAEIESTKLSKKQIRSHIKEFHSS